MYAIFSNAHGLPGRIMKSNVAVHLFFDSKDRIGIQFLPDISIGHPTRSEQCTGAELGHSDIPMPGYYYRSDEMPWPSGSYILYTIFSGSQYMKTSFSLLKRVLYSMLELKIYTSRSRVSI